MGCSESSSSSKRIDTSSRRAALLEGAMTSTINHPNVVQTFDYRVVQLNPQAAGPGVPTNRCEPGHSPDRPVESAGRELATFGHLLVTFLPPL